MRTAYEPFRKLNLHFFSRFPILFSGVKDSVHLLQYFVDCIYEVWKAGEGDSVTASTLHKSISLLLKNTDEKLKTNFVLWEPSVDLEA